VKLCAYRNLLGRSDFELGRPFHDAMLDANADGLVWGSDWPHLRVTPAPDTVALLDVLKRWTPDPAVVEKILVTNPHALYA
jgi:predicted TIM-barrel fold metal-dependent hydrolase